jgi:hypothetical protein
MPLVYDAVDRDANPEKIATNDGAERPHRRRDGIRDHAELPLHPTRRISNHSRIDADASGNGEVSTVGKPTEIDLSTLPVDQQWNGPPNVERNADSAGEEVPRSTSEDANGNAGADEGAGNLHHRAITTEREDSVIVATALGGQFRRMARSFRERDVAPDPRALERRDGSSSVAVGTACRRVCNEQRAGDHTRLTGWLEVPGS